MFYCKDKDAYKREINKNEWDKLNSKWKNIKNENKKQNPELYSSTDSDDNIDSENNTILVINIKSDNDLDNNADNNEPIAENNSKILKRCGSSYDELLYSQDCIITEKNEIKCDTPIFHDGVEDSKTHFTSSSSSSSHSTTSHNYFDNDEDVNDNEYFIDMTIKPASKITIEYIRKKYDIDNAVSLEVDYSINYNMKTLTHLGNYYNIIANNTGNKSFFDKLNDVNQPPKPKPKPKPKSTPVPKKMLKSELIKNIVLFETNELNYPTVLKYRQMLEKIDDLKADKYFSNFVLFP
jgi:hypothetical protein